MFIAMLRVEIADDVIWSSVLILASCAKTKSPPTCGHLKGSAVAAVWPADSVKSAPRATKKLRRINPYPSTVGAWRGCRGASSVISCAATCIAASGKWRGLRLLEWCARLSQFAQKLRRCPAFAVLLVPGRNLVVDIPHADPIGPVHQ